MTACGAVGCPGSADPHAADGPRTHPGAEPDRPRGIDPEKVTARYENGVLEVTVPLPAGHASRRVPVQIESHGSKKAA